MIGYMSSYYVPGPCYRGPMEVEAALEKQRLKSIELVVASLERYTGLDYGTNVDHWTEWGRETKKQRTSRCSEREPADSLRDKSNVIGGWLPSLTFALRRRFASSQRGRLAIRPVGCEI
ncbi:MAG: hypothetical protein HY343_13435 [Lentisphaerae bacterium]|nr:hypothetical protein [Lentisphaerota bacterium]